MKRINFEIEDDLHRYLKVISASQNKTMKEYLIELIKLSVDDLGAQTQ